MANGDCPPVDSRVRENDGSDSEFCTSLALSWQLASRPVCIIICAKIT